MDESGQKLAGILKQTDAIIGYTPMGDEPAYRAFLNENEIRIPEFLVPVDKETLPDTLGRALEATYRGKSVALFIPGRRFDQFGTRHGRGFGWYDRFLAGVPPEWVRIGVLSPELLHEKLERKNWDQPVDYLLIRDDTGYAIVETGARFPRT